MGVHGGRRKGKAGSHRGRASDRGHRAAHSRGSRQTAGSGVAEEGGVEGGLRAENRVGGSRQRERLKFSAESGGGGLRGGRGHAAALPPPAAPEPRSPRPRERAAAGCPRLRGPGNVARAGRGRRTQVGVGPDAPYLGSGSGRLGARGASVSPSFAAASLTSGFRAPSWGP